VVISSSSDADAITTATADGTQLTPEIGIRAKVENTHQYQEYLDELKPVREELGILLKEELYSTGTDSPFYNP